MFRIQSQAVLKKSRNPSLTVMKMRCHKAFLLIQIHAHLWSVQKKK